MLSGLDIRGSHPRLLGMVVSKLFAFSIGATAGINVG
jgi:hypothetical protein